MGSRTFRTVDLARRLGFVKPGHVVVEGSSREEPVAVFNPGLALSDGVLHVFPRIVVGYYRYVSAIAGFEVEAASALSGLRPGVRSVRARLEVTPGSWEDFWGAEDPRVTRVGGELVMVYAGRTGVYFAGRGGARVVPVVAVGGPGGWRRAGYVRVPGAEFDKDAFIVECCGGLLFFHRPSVGGENILSVVPLESIPSGVAEVPPGKPLLEPEPWESKLGWGAPPVEVDGRLIALVHAVDRDLGVYRVLALVLRPRGRGVEVEGVTRWYIMEPRAAEERFGDRPYVVFPTGAVLVDDSIIVAYGAADTATGFAEIRVDELMASVAWAG